MLIAIAILCNCNDLIHNIIKKNHNKENVKRNNIKKMKGETI